MKQRSKEWHEFRRNHIGSSDAAVCMGISPWKTKLDLYNEKIAESHVESVSNYAMRRGVELEPLALAKFEEDTGYLMTPRVIEHPTIPYMSASLDGLELDGVCAVEIKAPGRTDHELALKGIVPEKYIPQLQHIMEVCQLEEIYYMSYISDSDYTIFKVKKDHEYTKRLLDAELEFWNRIQSRNPPQPTDRDIKKITETSFASRAEEWRNLQCKKADIIKREEELKSEIIQLADYGSAEGFGIKVIKSVRRGHIDYARVPALDGLDLEPFRKESTEMFRISIQDQAVNE